MPCALAREWRRTEGMRYLGLHDPLNDLPDKCPDKIFPGTICLFKYLKERVIFYFGHRDFFFRLVFS